MCEDRILRSFKSCSNGNVRELAPCIMSTGEFVVMGFTFSCDDVNESNNPHSGNASMGAR